MSDKSKQQEQPASSPEGDDELKRVLDFAKKAAVGEVIAIDHRAVGGNDRVNAVSFQMGDSYENFRQLDPTEEQHFRKINDGIVKALRTHNKIVIKGETFDYWWYLTQKKGLQQPTQLVAAHLLKPIAATQMPDGNWLIFIMDPPEIVRDLTRNLGLSTLDALLPKNLDEIQ